MEKKYSTAELVKAAVFAALTFIATFAIKLQTPTFGYIHIGDSFVLLCGFILGGPLGALAAGIGSGLSDLIAGYAIWIPGTFIIKFLTALVAFYAFAALSKLFGQTKKYPAGLLVVSGLAGELVMVAGYFLYNIIVIALTVGGFSGAALASAITESAAEIPFNIVQGTVGIVLSTALYPLIKKVSK